MRNVILSFAAAACFIGSGWARGGDVAFDKQTLTDKFYSEGANVGDFNKDGKPDIVSGPFWYEGPDFKKAHPIFEAKAFDPASQYSNSFFSFVDDFNHDGWDDVLVVGFPGADGTWFENPKDPQATAWKRHLALEPVDNESPSYIDLTGDGKPELVCNHDLQFGYATPDPANPEKSWVFHPISPKNPANQRFTHGIGAGDINGDGKPDLIEKTGWWEQPTGAPEGTAWKQHPFNFATNGAQMYAYDVNGDGKADVVTSLNAHGYGLAWYEQVTKDGEISFVQHLILQPKAVEDQLSFSQLHAVDLVDINGDGLKDIVTGKRHYAHGDHGDPEPKGPAVLYWFELKRSGDGKAEFVPHKIDDASGVGTMVLAKDVNADGKPDIIVGNKSGTFVFTQK